MFKIIRPLDWKVDTENNVIHATPEGMRWSYYITLDDINKYNLVYMEENGDFEEHEELIGDLELAKLIAGEHYHKHVALNILPEYLK